MPGFSIVSESEKSIQYLFLSLSGYPSVKIDTPFSNECKHIADELA
jgi:hypothetical protein